MKKFMAIPLVAALVCGSVAVAAETQAAKPNKLAIGKAQFSARRV